MPAPIDRPSKLLKSPDLNGRRIHPRKRYADLTDADRALIVASFDQSRQMGAPLAQAVAAAAYSAFDLSLRQWNGKLGGDCFAEASAVLLMAGRITPDN